MRRWVQALDKGWIAVCCGLFLPIGIAAAMVPVRENFASPAAALILVLVVVAVACFGSRLAGVVAAASAAAWFDFFLVKPYDLFTITHTHDLETTICLFVVGVAITEIAARSRSHREVASDESHLVALIHDFTQMVASGEPAEFVIARAAGELTTLLGLKDCRFDTSLSTRHPTRIEHSGVVALAGLRWGASHTGLPGREVELIVEFRGEFFGRFVMTPVPGSPVSSDHLLVAALIADEVGAALSQRAGTA
ncbi:MAG: DUF4118 domain-containing protein [Acidimicrobiales bacterium]|jgi:hypothetical protein